LRVSNKDKVNVEFDRIDSNFWPYLAGLIDSKGTISIYIHEDKSVDRGFTWDTSLKITHKNKQFLEALQSKFGGSVSKSGKFYQFRIGGNKVRAVLKKTVPFILLKQKQAIWALQALDLVYAHKSKSFDSVKTDKSLNMLRLRIQTVNNKNA